MVRASGGMGFSQGAADDWAKARGIPVPYDPKDIFSDSAADRWANDRSIVAQRLRHFRRRADMQFQQVPADITRVMLYGRDAEGDAPPALLRRAVDASEQALTTALATADGAKWVFDERQVWERAWFGASDYAGIAAALNNAMYRIQPKVADTQLTGSARINPGDGGELRLGPGVWMAGAPLVLPSRVGIVGSGCRSTQLIKASTWPAGETLLSHRGGAATQAEANTGRYFKSFNRIQHMELHGNDRTGALLDSSYSAVCRYDDLLLSACPGTAWLLEDTWDSRFYGVDLGYCGGTTGAEDAAIRITSSLYDMSNLLRFYGMRQETFRKCAIFIGKGSPESVFSPYMITFEGLKLESVILPDNTTVFMSDPSTSAIALRDTYIHLEGSAPRTGLRGIDLDGTAHIVDGLKTSVGSNVSAISTVRAPRGGSKGGTIRNVEAGTQPGGTLQMIVEVDNLRADGNNLIHVDRSLKIDDIKPLTGVPIVGSTTVTGLESSNAQIPQLRGRRMETAQTFGRTIRRNEMNRVVRFSAPTTPATFTIDAESANGVYGYDGDVITVLQEGAAKATLAPYTGNTLLVPPGLSASTNGIGTTVSAVRDAKNQWRIAPVYQRTGAPVATATASRNFAALDLNNMVPFNHSTTAATLTIPAGLGQPGDVLVVSQENAAIGTIAAAGGVTLQVPSGYSAATNGQFTQVQVRNMGINIWRVF